VERAEAHVETAGRFAWLQTDDWPQADVEKLRRLMGRLSDDEQTRLYQFMEEVAAPMTPRKDRIFEYAEIMPLKTQAQRDEIYRLWGSDDEREKSLARTRALHRPPMPDARSVFISEALTHLKKAVKPPFNAEPECEDFRQIIDSLKALDRRLDQRYQELKTKEARYVEADLNQRSGREAVSA
jgi:hypothetical protein